jgi:mannose/fructose/N-acetylgalactosamine-specific phosphotransferase system component IID
VSPLDPPVAPAGEEIHLPGASLQPLLLAVGITMSLLGITIGPVVMIIGLVLSVWVIIRWIADTRRDINALPVDHDEH